MTFLDAIIYGVLQGVAEFLPISSSGHLAVLPHYLKIADPGVAFDMCMHVGTAAAIMIYFKTELFSFFKEIPAICFKRAKPSPLLLNVAIAFIATVTLALLLKNLAFEFGRSPYFIAFNLAFFGILMWIADRRKDSMEDQFKKNSWKSALIIGLAQALSIFPGVSRSGITLTAARFCNINRKEAATFSFLLSLPIVLGGAVEMVPELFTESNLVDPLVTLTGLLVSFLTGILTIHYFMKLISKIGLHYFTVYRLLLAAAIVLTFSMH